MTETLLPCPFCGGEARVIVADEVTDAGCEEATVPLYAASCPYCGARGPMALSEDEAVEAWNRRAERTCRVVRSGEPSPTGVLRERRCSECGGMLTRFGAYYHNCGARVVD